MGMYIMMNTYGATIPSKNAKGSFSMGGIFMGTVIAVIWAV